MASPGCVHCEHCILLGPLLNLPSLLPAGGGVCVLEHTLPQSVSSFKCGYREVLYCGKEHRIICVMITRCKEILWNHYLTWKAQNRFCFPIFPKQRQLFQHKLLLSKCSSFLFSRKPSFYLQNKSANKVVHSPTHYAKFMSRASVGNIMKADNLKLPPKMILNIMEG